MELVNIAVSNVSEDENELRKLMVSGSRTITSKQFVFNCLNYTRKNLYEFNVIIEGEAGEHKDPEKREVSVDLLAKLYAEEKGLGIMPMEAEWNVFGRSAGFIRNSDMVKKTDKGIAIHNLISKGTLDAIIKLIKSNKLIAIFLKNTENVDRKIIEDYFEKFSDYIINIE